MNNFKDELMLLRESDTQIEWKFQKIDNDKVSFMNFIQSGDANYVFFRTFSSSPTTTAAAAARHFEFFHL
jgi:hypothetical protein